ncbi:isoaspartyl peptidase/L-asparaginase [Actinomadura sp. 3N508]|uniref:isoaspartyl peptidase/L-asparaginase n=1 Tax=Actinomadura sp. 3N508 TaxID=3375153 RepID=UPI003793EF0F
MRSRVLVHGGIDCPDTPEVRAALARAAGAGLAALLRDGTPCDAVVAAISVLEDDPLFNAGYGSVLNRDGRVEVDAGLADGATGRYAAVGAAPGVRNPIQAAGSLLADADGPVLLAGEGAARYAAERGIATGSLVTGEQLASWRGDGAGVSRFTGRAVRTETVGCVAVSPEGTRGGPAAGSSTGGFQGKVPGRIGDAAVHGAGFYADPAGAAVCSGLGEATMRVLLARRAVRLIPEGDPAAAAVRELLGSRDIAAGVLTYDPRTDRASAAHHGASFPVMSATPEGTEHIPSVRLEVP